MAVEEQNYTALRFSTRDLPSSKRLPAVRELFDRSIQLEIDAEPGQAVEMEMLMTPGVRRAKMLSSLTARVSRSAHMLADGEDTICLMMKTSGHMALTQRGRAGVPQVGDGILLVYREQADLQFVDATYVSVRVPFSAISILAKNVGESAGLRIPGNTEALSLLRAYLATLPNRVIDPRLGLLSATHVYDLIALAIGATDEGRAIAGRRGVRSARLEAIKADLIQNISLSLDQLAAHHRISPRYVQMLFEESGSSYSEFALECRLDAARRMLISPRYQHHSILAIALEAGFSDLSHFNRRFKRRYLITPSDMRAGGGARMS